MIIDNKPDYNLITGNESNFNDFISSFDKNYIAFKEKHLIINISNYFNITKENILVFLRYAHEHQNNNMSFVLITNDVNIDDFPETLNIVPTLVEAEDIIEMENIERDLGF